MTKQPPSIGTPSPTRPKDQSIIPVPPPRDQAGLGLNVKDGWNFGIGFGLAMAIVVPLILLFMGCLVIFALAFFGSSLGALL